MEESESREQIQARHRRELKDLQGRITNKKKNATKKTRKGVNDECSELEKQLRDKQADELAALNGNQEGVGESAEAEAQDTGPETANDGGTKTDGPGDGGDVDLGAKKPEDASQNAQVSNGTSQPGKKRNRQKERLARRAAEQEAAAQKAEDEASNMTDHRARESEYMKKVFKQHSLVEKDIEPDGHCLFSAMADQLGQNSISLGAHGEPGYKIVRRAAAAYMTENAGEFAPFLDEDLEAYAAKMRDTAEWGGQLELMALARRYGAEIRVVQDGRTERIGEEEGSKGTGKTLWLAYYRHGYGLGEHYNSLRKAA